MSKPIDARMMCLDAAIRTHGVQHERVVEQAKAYSDFVLGVKHPKKVPAKAPKKKSA